MDPSQELFVRMVMLSWETQNGRTTKLLNSLSDQQLLSEVSPGRNRGIYLLGHLTAVNDAMAVTLGLGPRIFPDLESTYIKNPDNAATNMPDILSLRISWDQVTQKLKEYFGKMSAGDWFLRHTAISDEDFIKEPHRNRLNVLMTRISHEAYHQGQLTLLQKK